MARPNNNSVVSYAPGPPPGDPKDLQGFLQGELAAIAVAINSLAQQGGLTTVVPPKPRSGMIRLADGVHWDPLSLAGTTAYYVGYANGAWVAV